MNLSTKDAQDSLSEIKNITLQTQRSIIATYSNPYLILWGLIWMVAFSLTQFFHRFSGEIWMVFGGVGTVITLLICWRQTRSGSPFKVADAAKFRGRILGFWLLLGLFTFMWLMLLKPIQGVQMGAFICRVVMFAYVVKGIWFESNFLIYLGLVVTALTLAGYYLLEQYFSLWMAPTGGGALLVSGLYIRLRWR